MKKSLMTVFTLAVMLILGGMAYGQSASDPGQDLQQGGAYGTAGQNMGQGAEKLSVNTASAQELQRVAGLDRNVAQNVIDYRTANGPFSSIDHLSRVQGIDKQQLDQLRQTLSTSINLNTASADQLRKVPGINQTLAQNIIQYREANGPFSSVNDLSRVQGVDNFRMDMIKKYVQVGGSQG
ncbi:MAG TPA: helix-hairpin-helix domain-containing protein [Deltaproteobacteria bacterium]|jgi:competence ComEA-like helix-hairpin-helix protein|nr:helix-hairpin-helix domain-containing protein [Deltaproteobacteria bacterium]HOI07650.1 helix-hairpin-helix domain-containing protein [Deltaproteobacteria bacterium]